MFSCLSSFLVEHNLDLDDALISLLSSHLQTPNAESPDIIRASGNPSLT